MKKYAISLLVLALAVSCLLALASCGDKPAPAECEHSWGEGVVITPAQCTTDGVMSYVCTKCAETKTESIPAAHAWDTEFTVDQAATCSAEGSKSIHCANCSETKDVTAIETTAHAWDADFTVDQTATCTADGSKSIHCANCAATKDVTAIPAAHAWEEDFTVDQEATCAVAGSKSIHCANCTATKDATPIVADHHYISVDTATFYADGFKGNYCTMCGDFKDKVASPKTAVTTVAAGTEGRVEGEYNGNYAAHVLGFVDNGIFETNKMYPTATQSEGKDIFFEFSFLLHEGLDDGGEKEIRFIQLCPVNNYSKSVALHWLTLAPEITSGDSAPYFGTMITEKEMHEEVLDGDIELGIYARKSLERGDYIDIGAAGWHRIGVQLHEDAAIVDGEVEYTMTYTLYIDGVFWIKTTLGVDIKDFVGRNLIPYTAEIVDNKLVYTDNPNAGISPWRFDKLFNAATPDTASVSYADMYLTCGDGFVMPVEKLATPVDVEGTNVYFAVKQ